MTRDGTLITIDGAPALRFERRYDRSIERVWRAVTDPDEMSNWFPAAVLGDRSVGAELVFDDDAQRAAARDSGEPTRADGPVFRGTVIAFDPPERFEFTWGGELLRIELARDGAEATALRFTHVLGHQSVAARNGAGWHMCLAELDRMLGAATDPDTDDGGDGNGMGVYEDYLERVGPELGGPGSDGSMTWERSTHVAPDRVRAVTDDRPSWAGWGADQHTGEPLTVETEPTATGTLYRVTHGTIGSDASLAATWHALLVQLDMYLAAGQLVPVDAARWVEPYRELLAGDEARGVSAPAR